METNESENINTRTRRDNKEKGVDCIKMKFGGGEYDTQFATSTGEKKKIFYE